jgi:uncharacterized membrane protein YhaH (DUF805 family)
LSAPSPIARLFGRSRRGEYWLSLAALTAAETMLVLVKPHASVAIVLAPLLPWLLICARRLHDIGLGGVWALLTPVFDIACGVAQHFVARALGEPFEKLTPAVVPVVVVVALGVVLLQGVWRSQPGDNRFGRGRGAGVDLTVFE